VHGHWRGAARSEGLTMQDINLYQPVSRGVRGALSAGSSRSILLVVGAALLGLWGFATWQIGHLNQVAEVVRAQQRAQAAMSAASGPQLDALSDEEIEALVARLSASVDTKSRALALLGAQSRAGASFSARLRAFGARHVDGIWLDHLAFGADAESVGMSGSTLSPATVPRYLRNLALDPALEGGKIDEFVIERPVTGPSAGRLTFKAGRRGLVIHPPIAADAATAGESG
jgi:hypothetical protein